MEVIAVVVAALILAGGIGYGAYLAIHNHYGTPTPATITPSPAPTPSPSRPTTTFTNKNNGQTVYVKIGSTFTVSLDSTYWAQAGITSSNSEAVKASGSPVVTPVSGCVAGEGCGTTQQKFQAIAAGRSTITSSSTSCGEAIRCSSSQGSFNLLVVVQ